MERLIEVAASCASGGFAGYIHLKGIRAVVRLLEKPDSTPDRLSVNLELPISRNMACSRGRNRHRNTKATWASSARAERKPGQRRCSSALDASLRSRRPEHRAYRRSEPEDDRCIVEAGRLALSPIRTQARLLFRLRPCRPEPACPPLLSAPPPRASASTRRTGPAPIYGYSADQLLDEAEISLRPTSTRSAPGL